VLYPNRLIYPTLSLLFLWFFLSLLKRIDCIDRFDQRESRPGHWRLYGISRMAARTLLVFSPGGAAQRGMRASSDSSPAADRRSAPRRSPRVCSELARLARRSTPIWGLPPIRWINTHPRGERRQIGLFSLIITGRREHRAVFRNTCNRFRGDIDNEPVWRERFNQGAGARGDQPIGRGQDQPRSAAQNE